VNSQNILIGEKTFSVLFDDALHKTVIAAGEDALRNYLLHGLDLNTNVTYVFELTGPYNRVVVRYEEPRVTLIAARDITTGEELNINELPIPRYIPRPKTWNIKDVVALRAFVDNADPGKLEGAVVCDSSFNRLKVKNKSWVLSSKAREMVTTSPRSGLEAIIQQSIDDVLPLIEKDVASKLVLLQAAYAAFCKHNDELFESFIRNSTTRKEFALQVQASDALTYVMFALYDDVMKSRKFTLSCDDYIRTLSIDGKLSPSMLDKLLNVLNMSIQPSSVE
jgi:hypothetical protein